MTGGPLDLPGDIVLPDLAQAARKSGLTVVELPGWRTRSRPASSGGFSPRGVLCHHTGGESDSRDYVEWMATVGRSDLPAPLCQLALDRKGTVYVLAAGRANHGGTAKATGPMPAGDANLLYVGIEALNTGSEGWTDVQFSAYARLCAALCQHYGWPAANVRAHRETSVTGKWDPGLLDMDVFRRNVAALIDNPSLEDEMNPEQEKLLNQVAADVREIKRVQGRSTNREIKTNALLRKLRKQVGDPATVKEIEALLAESDGDASPRR